MIEGARTITASDLLSYYEPPTHDASARQSAVLMLWGETAEGPDLLLTERSHSMRSHPGQVSFPGGRLDAGESYAEAALREANEEIGLDPATVEIVGQLPELYLPPSNSLVTPIVGWWREPHPVHIASPDEVHGVYRVSIAHLQDHANRIRVRSPRNDAWVGPGFLVGPDNGVILWGFTGGIVQRFLQHIGWLDEYPDAPLLPLPEYMVWGSPVSTTELQPGDELA